MQKKKLIIASLKLPLFEISLTAERLLKLYIISNSIPTCFIISNPIQCMLYHLWLFLCWLSLTSVSKTLRQVSLLSLCLQEKCFFCFPKWMKRPCLEEKLFLQSSQEKDSSDGSGSFCWSCAHEALVEKALCIMGGDISPFPLVVGAIICFILCWADVFFRPFAVIRVSAPLTGKFSWGLPSLVAFESLPFTPMVDERERPGMMSFRALSGELSACLGSGIPLEFSGLMPTLFEFLPWVSGWEVALMVLGEERPGIMLSAVEVFRRLGSLTWRTPFISPAAETLWAACEDCVGGFSTTRGALVTASSFPDLIVSSPPIWRRKTWENKKVIIEEYLKDCVDRVVVKYRLVLVKPLGRVVKRWDCRGVQKIVNHWLRPSLAVRRAQVWVVEVKDGDNRRQAAAEVLHLPVDVRPNQDHSQFQLFCKKFHESEKISDELIFHLMASIIPFTMETWEQHLFSRSFRGGLQDDISGLGKEGDLSPPLLIQNQPGLLVDPVHFKPLRVDKDSDRISLVDVDLAQGKLAARNVVVHLLLHLSQILVCKCVLSENDIRVDFCNPLANYLQHLKSKRLPDCLNYFRHLRRPDSLPTIHFLAATMPEVDTKRRHRLFFQRCHFLPSGGSHSSLRFVESPSRQRCHQFAVASPMPTPMPTLMPSVISPLSSAKPYSRVWIRHWDNSWHHMCLFENVIGSHL